MQNEGTLLETTVDAMKKVAKDKILMCSQAILSEGRERHFRLLMMLRDQNDEWSVARNDAI